MLGSIGFVIVFAMTSQSPNGKNPQDALNWQSDYYVAQKKGVQDKKPLAVFVGSAGQSKLVQDWPASLSDTLARKYVVVYLDNNKAENRELIRALAITSGQGLVISDRTGTVQAFHHDGALTSADLAKHLPTLADAGVQVRTTLTNGQQRVSYYPGGVLVRPTSFPPPTSIRNC